MARYILIREMYNVETDDSDWPSGLPENERKILVKLIKARVEQFTADGCAPTTYDLVKWLSKIEPPELSTFNRAVVVDWIHGCVERACRAADLYQAWIVK